MDSQTRRRQAGSGGVKKKKADIGMASFCTFAAQLLACRKSSTSCLMSSPPIPPHLLPTSYPPQGLFVGDIGTGQFGAVGYSSGSCDLFVPIVWRHGVVVVDGTVLFYFL